MLHFAVGIVLLVFVILGYGTVALIVATVRPASPIIDRLTHSFSRTCFRLALSRFEVEGQELADPRRSYVVVSNHTSAIDIPASFLASPVPVRFLAKKELFKIPFMGWVMRAIGIVRTDRQAGRAAHATINEGIAKAVGLGKSLIIYAEGTRTDTDDVVPFKKGAFRIAIDNQLDVLPISILGGWRVWRARTYQIHRGMVHAKVHPPIPVAGLGNGDIDRIKNETYDAIASGLEELKARS